MTMDKNMLWWNLFANKKQPQMMSWSAILHTREKQKKTKANKQKSSFPNKKRSSYIISSAVNLDN